MFAGILQKHSRWFPSLALSLCACQLSFQIQYLRNSFLKAMIEFPFTTLKGSEFQIITTQLVRKFSLMSFLVLLPIPLNLWPLALDYPPNGNNDSLFTGSINLLSAFTLLQCGQSQLLHSVQITHPWVHFLKTTLPPCRGSSIPSWNAASRFSAASA